VIIGLYIRLKIMETPAFAKAQEQNKIVPVPVVELFRTHTKNTVLGLGARYIEGVTFNIYGVFLVGYLTSTLHMTRQSALSAVMVASAIMIVMLPLCGKLSDRIGRRVVFGIASLLLGVLSFVAFYLMDGTSTLMTIIAVAIPFAIVYPAVYGPEAALFSELFDTRVRYTGISFVYQFSGIFASGLTPIIATALLPLGGGKPWLICLYILVVSAISALSVYAMTDRHKSNITADQKLVTAGG
jgi:MFS transporter, MHS family, shikimate and dehydroshikimate transport protein